MKTIKIELALEDALRIKLILGNSPRVLSDKDHRKLFCLISEHISAEVKKQGLDPEQDMWKFGTKTMRQSTQATQP